MPDRAPTDAEAPAAAEERVSRLITRDDIRRFAVAIGATAPVHHEPAAARAAGYADVLAPLFFFCTLGLSLGRVLPSDQLRADGMPLSDSVEGRVVAGGSTIEWRGDIVAGDEVEYAQRFVERYEARGRSGPMVCYVFERTYQVRGQVVVVERLVRIGR